MGHREKARRPIVMIGNLRIELCPEKNPGSFGELMLVKSRKKRVNRPSEICCLDLL